MPEHRTEFILILRALNALIRVDDVVTVEEEAFLERLMSTMNLSSDEREAVLEPIEDDEDTDALRKLSPPLLKGLIKSLVKASKSDGVVDDRERTFVDNLAHNVGISQADMEHLWNLPGGRPLPSSETT